MLEIETPPPALKTGVANTAFVPDVASWCHSWISAHSTARTKASVRMLTIDIMASPAVKMA
jgi:hypothetical protein